MVKSCFTFNDAFSTKVFSEEHTLSWLAVISVEHFFTWLSVTDLKAVSLNLSAESLLLASLKVKSFSVSSFLVKFSELITFKFLDNSSNEGAEECVIVSEDLTNSYKKNIKKYQNQGI